MYDCHSAALVDGSGSVEWWCLPRFDSPSIFERLLDDEAGHFTVRPTDITEMTRRYEEGSLVPTTTFHTSSGTVELTDALAGRGRQRPRPGRRLPTRVAATRPMRPGRSRSGVRVRSPARIRARFPLLRHSNGGVIARGGASMLRLSTSAPLDIEGSTARGSTFWLTEVLARAGRQQEARDVFEWVIAHVNDVGLLAEQVDADTGELVGNFPQAFSHVGLINAAWAIGQAEEQPSHTDVHPSDETQNAKGGGQSPAPKEDPR